jgi:hypothetical protein
MPLTFEQQVERQSREPLVRELESAGGKFKGNYLSCPYHSDASPSAGIFQDSLGAWHYRCHGCNVKGDVFDIRARNLNCDLSASPRLNTGSTEPIYSLTELQSFDGLRSAFTFTQILIHSSLN